MVSFTRMPSPSVDEQQSKAAVESQHHLTKSFVKIETTADGDVRTFHVEPSYEKSDENVKPEVQVDTGGKSVQLKKEDAEDKNSSSEQQKEQERETSPSTKARFAGRTHTRDLSAHFFDATRLSDDINNIDRGKDDARRQQDQQQGTTGAPQQTSSGGLPPRSSPLSPGTSNVGGIKYTLASPALPPVSPAVNVGEKHRRGLSGDTQSPAYAHRRINSVGNSAPVYGSSYKGSFVGGSSTSDGPQTSSGQQSSRHHREGSAGLDILTAVIADVSKEELANAAGSNSNTTRGENRNSSSTTWEPPTADGRAPPMETHVRVPKDGDNHISHPTYDHHGHIRRSSSGSGPPPTHHPSHPPPPPPPPPRGYAHPPGGPMHVQYHHYGYDSAGPPPPHVPSGSYPPPPPPPPQHHNPTHAYYPPPPYEYHHHGHPPPPPPPPQHQQHMHYRHYQPQHPVMAPAPSTGVPRPTQYLQPKRRSTSSNPPADSHYEKQYQQHGQLPQQPMLSRNEPSMSSHGRQLSETENIFANRETPTPPLPQEQQQQQQQQQQESAGNNEGGVSWGPIRYNTDERGASIGRSRTDSNENKSMAAQYSEPQQPNNDNGAPSQPALSVGAETAPVEAGHHRKLSSFSSFSGFVPGLFTDSESNGVPVPRASPTGGFFNGIVDEGDAFLQSLTSPGSGHPLRSPGGFTSSPRPSPPQFSYQTQQQPPPPPGQVGGMPPRAPAPAPASSSKPASGTANEQTPSSGTKLASGGTSKRVRRKCTVENCPNRVVQGGLCIAHGAKRKTCKFEGCTKNVKKAGLCSTHGPARKRCDAEGCSKVAVQGGRCIAHGAKKKLCSVEGCTKQAILTGMCKKHHDQKNGIVSARASGRGKQQQRTAPAEAISTPLPDSSSPTPPPGSSVMCIPISVDQQQPKASPKLKKPMHKRGLSLFQELGADTVKNILSTDSSI